MNSSSAHLPGLPGAFHRALSPGALLALILVAGADARDLAGDPPPAALPWRRLYFQPTTDHSVILDPVRRRLILYGGVDRTSHGSPLAWEFSLDGRRTWLPLATEGGPATPYFRHLAVYDPLGDRMIVLGGYPVWTSTPRGDIWELPLSGTARWTEIPAAGALPTTTHLWAAAYDPAHQRIVCYGGFRAADYTWVTDIWMLTLGPQPAWSQVTPSGAPPVGRVGAGWFYDPVGDRFLLYGGWTSAALFDLWELRLTPEPAWTQLSPIGLPQPQRRSYAMAYDPTRHRALLFGGSAGYRQHWNDVWELRLEDPPVWTLLGTTGEPPTGRTGHSVAFDAASDRLLVAGGVDNDYYRASDDVWQLSFAADAAWSRLGAPDDVPFQREGLRAIHDPGRERTVVFGGAYVSYAHGLHESPFDDVWALTDTDRPRWTQLSPSGTPPMARMEHSAVYDPEGDRVLVFGGRNPYYGYYFLGDTTWALRLAEPTEWTALAAGGTPPSPRWGHSAVHDPGEKRMVLFGGAGANGALNDVHVLSLGETPAWTRLDPTGDAPSPRFRHSAILDPLRRRMLVFGGTDGSQAVDASVWALSLDGDPVWTRLDPAGGPTGRLMHAALYDPIEDRMLVAGGADSVWYSRFSGPSVRVWFNDVWELPLGTDGPWRRLAAQSPFGARFGHALAYDADHDRITLVHGTSGSAGERTFETADTWMLDLDRVVPARFHLVEARAVPGRVRLSWRAPQAARRVAVVYRSGTASEWVALGSPVASGRDLLDYEDASARPGETYGYRLGIQRDGEETLVGETRVTVPVEPGLAIIGLGPNPARDGWDLRLNLPVRAPARVEVFDLAGRVVAVERIEGMVGPHALRVGAPGLDPGLYWVRVTQGGSSVRTRACALR